jgi:hypothetical protein
MKNTVKDKKITYREVSAGLGDEKKYVVAADNVKFAEFMLKKKSSPSTPEDTWELCSVKSFYHQAENISLKVLKSSKLYINGILVSDDYIIKDSITTDSCKHMPDGVEGIMYREYEINGLLLKPDFKVIDRYGNESSVVYDENNFYFAEQLEYDKYTESIKDLTRNAVQTYARYMTLDTSLANVKKYFDADSQIFTYIKTSDTWCYTPHIGYDFKNIEYSEYYKYDENTFSTRYKCDHFVYRAGFDPYLFPLDLTLYFKNINRTFFVYDMVSNY